ncbi:DUF1016 family protein [Candidatus Micrarchaeota archaeon]|nr:DUF1016 family protein [Candidatus Micrarchaeota archaeon]
MKTKEGKTKNTVNSYAYSIDKISNHYFEQTGKKIDIYQLNDTALLKSIKDDYGIGGRFVLFGKGGNGTIRNAIATFYRFIKETNPLRNDSSDSQNTVDESLQSNDNNDDEIVAYDYNFTYERDLKNALVNQVGDLFPGYKVYGSTQEGIEYEINGKKIDVLLENIVDNSMLVVELKSGVADFRVYGQISMYLGLVSEKFPDRQIRGIIIAGKIDKSLHFASKITNKISLKTYQMQLTLDLSLEFEI